MASFSFDIVSDYDKAEMNNVFAQAGKEIENRYDFKGTPAGVEWLGDKTGFKIIGSNDWQVDAVLEIVSKKLAGRNMTSKVLDLRKEVTTSNLRATKEVPFVEGLDAEKAKKITRLLRDEFPKVKTQIQGSEVRATSGSKDELQAVIRRLRAADFEFPLSFINYR